MNTMPMLGKRAKPKRASAGPGRKLRIDTLIYASAITVDRLLGLLLLPVLTRLLTPAEYGTWTQTGIASGLLIAIILYAFPTVIVRHYAAESSPMARARAFDYIGLLCAGLLFLVSLGAALVPSGIAGLVYGDTIHRSLVPALLVWVVADAVVEFAIAWWRALGRIVVIASVLICRSTLRFMVSITMATQSGLPLEGWLFHYGLALASFALVVLAATRRAIRGGTDRLPMRDQSPLRELAKEATPLVVLSVLTVLSGSFDRYLLAAWLGLDTVAAYAAASSLAAVPFMFQSILGFTLYPAMSRHWAEGRRTLATTLMDQSLLAYLFLSLPVAMAVAVLGHWLLPLVATADYQVNTFVFIGLSLSVLALGVQQILIYGLLLEGRGPQLLRLTLTGCLLNITLMLLLVPRYGTIGAATAVALANLSVVAMTARSLRQSLDWRFPWRRAARHAGHTLLAGLPLVLQAWIGRWTLTTALSAMALAVTFYLLLDWRRSDSVLRRTIMS